MLASVIHQHASATGIHISLPSWSSSESPTPSQPSRLSQSTGLSSLCQANFHWLSVLHMLMYVFMLLSQVTPPTPSWLYFKLSMISVFYLNCFIGTYDCWGLVAFLCICQCWEDGELSLWLFFRKDYIEMWSNMERITIKHLPPRGPTLMTGQKC